MVFSLYNQNVFLTAKASLQCKVLEAETGLDTRLQSEQDAVHAIRDYHKTTGRHTRLCLCLLPPQDTLMSVSAGQMSISVGQVIASGQMVSLDLSWVVSWHRSLQWSLH